MGGYIKKPQRDKLVKIIMAKGGKITEIATACDCGIHAVNQWIRHDPTLKQVILDAKDSMIDLAESKLHENISSNNENVSQRAVEFTLRYLGGKRGYSEKQVIEHVEVDRTLDVKWGVE